METPPSPAPSGGSSGEVSPRGGAVAPESRIGTLIQGEYLIERLLREEDLGFVYEAQNNRLKGRFQLLMLRKEVSPALKVMVAVRNDLRKARAVSALGFLPVEQLADPGGQTGFAWESLPGETLRERLARGPLKVEQALALTGVLGRALSEAHVEGLVHGDLRPENVLLVRPEAKHTFAGRAMLLRYGLHHIRWYVRQQRLLWRRGEPLPAGGPWAYAAPELLSGALRTPDGRSDVYALGLILHECLGGEVPAPGPEPLPLLGAQPAIGLLPDLAATLNVVIAGATARDVGSRINTMEEFVKALRQVAQGAKIPWPEAAGRRQVSIVRRLTGKLRPVAGPDAPAPPLTEREARSAAAGDRSDPSLPEHLLEELSEPTPAPFPTAARPPAPPPRAVSAEAAPPAGAAGAAAAVATPGGAGAGPTQISGRVRDKDSTLVFSLQERPQRRDVSQLVAAVQAGEMDPLAAVQAAQEVDPYLIRSAPSPLVPRGRDLVAAALGGLLVLLVQLLLRLF